MPAAGRLRRSGGSIRLTLFGRDCDATEPATHRLAAALLRIGRAWIEGLPEKVFRTV